MAYEDFILDSFDNSQPYLPHCVKEASGVNSCKLAKILS